ncbi:MAG: transcriptional regulator [Rhodobacteraceae bacterium PARR1]|nr:MAG: transcriptional regulator [Rhodobacteraceae bacterium PARR1]
MARPRSIPDTDIYAAIRALLARDGEKAVAFGTVARLTGLAAPSLVQRYANRDGMIRAALLDGWQDLLSRTTTTAESQPQALLKALAEPAAAMTRPALMALTLRDATLRAAAEAWRVQLESLLALRLGGGARGAESAAMLFAAWQGQLLWLQAGGKNFRIKEAAKRLT